VQVIATVWRKSKRKNKMFKVGIMRNNSKKIAEKITWMQGIENTGDNGL
jgi:hypothetical protein